MKYSFDQIVDVARAIRPYISELLDAPSAQLLEKQLANFFSNSSLTEEHYAQLSRHLMQYEATQEWIKLYIEEHHSAENILDLLRVYYPLKGLKHPMKSPRYICPVKFCNQDWYRHQLEEEIPKCPVHDLALIIDS